MFIIFSMANLLFCTKSLFAGWKSICMWILYFQNAKMSKSWQNPAFELL